MRNSSGFTLVELVIVIVILGILAVIAIPKYIDLSSDARAAAANSVAASLSAANTLNYADRSKNPSKGIPIANCADVAGALSGGLPSGYAIIATPIAVGSVAKCILTGAGGVTATFSATGIN